jgi:predicted nucleic acid-binding protein
MLPAISSKPMPSGRIKREQSAADNSGDGGEQEAILLAQELHADLVLLDDREARKAAIRRALRVMGTVGVLEQAAIHELIDLPEVCARLLTTNFRIKDSIIHNVLARDAARKAAGG